MGALSFSFITVALLLVTCNARVEDQQQASANPIRKVVTMLQNMQKKVTAEGEKEKELFDKFMCYCKTSGGDLQQSIATAEGKIAEVDSALKEGAAQKAQLEEELKANKASREDAKDAIAKAKALREKEAADFAKESAEYKSNIAALDGAIKAISKGAAGGFLQARTANRLKQLVISQELSDADREDMMAFLTGAHSEGYVPQSGQILGILKQMSDEMSKNLADATAEEESAIASTEALIAAKTKEIEALTKGIEEKSQRVGELAVMLAQGANDLEDTQEALADDKKFLADLGQSCDEKQADFDERSKTRAEELVALADTIKVLNDDDALDLFKKTLPSASFLQLKVKGSTLRSKALAVLEKAKKDRKPLGMELDFVELALHGKSGGFEKVIKMIDEMVANLAEEQKADDAKKDYCNNEFDSSDDQKKALENSIADEENAMASAEEAISNLKAEIKALQDSIKALDKNVAELSEQRKADHEDYTELMSNDSAAKELLAWAKNRLNKFYNPKLYVPPPKRELSEDESITVAFGGSLAPTAAPGGIAGTGISLAQVSAHSHREAPPPPPETYGAYAKKSQEGGGVVAMIDLLVKDLDREMTEAQTTEENAQKAYESDMSDAATARAADSKSLTSKEGMLANAETELQRAKEAKAGASKELALTMEYIAGLHSECDWLLKYFDVRKAARAGEVDALGKAKAVLNGADYSLMQVQSMDRSHKFLSH